MEPTRPPRTVLVAVEDDVHAGDLVRVAFDLAGTGGGVVALGVTWVPSSLPLSGLPGEIDERARNGLRTAQEVAQRLGNQIEARLRRGRNVARVIALEARSVEADAIVLTLHTPRLSWLPLRLSRTDRAVLRQAPCPVFFGYFPSTSPRGGRSPGALDASRAVAEAERLLGQAP